MDSNWLHCQTRSDTTQKTRVHSRTNRLMTVGQWGQRRSINLFKRTWRRGTLPVHKQAAHRRPRIRPEAMLGRGGQRKGWKHLEVPALQHGCTGWAFCRVHHSASHEKAIEHKDDYSRSLKLTVLWTGSWTGRPVRKEQSTTSLSFFWNLAIIIFRICTLNNLPRIWKLPVGSQSGSTRPSNGAGSPGAQTCCCHSSGRGKSRGHRCALGCPPLDKSCATRLMQSKSVTIESQSKIRNLCADLHTRFSWPETRIEECWWPAIDWHWFHASCE